MTYASQEVFETAELLEAILEDVDMKTLLHSQRVNKMFKATIDYSVRLQRALWFKPTPPSKDDAFTHTPNPLINKRANTLGIRDIDCPRKAYLSHGIVFRALPSSSVGSWRRMIPFQPAAGKQTCLAYLDERARLGVYKGYDVVEFQDLQERADGLTMAEIVDALSELRKSRMASRRAEGLYIPT